MDMAHAKEAHKSRQRIVDRSTTAFKVMKDLEASAARKLELVLKCDSFGSVEAVEAILGKLKVPGVAIQVIHSGVGAVSKSDLVMALSGSRLVLGFNVPVMPKLGQWVKEHGVEVRLYQVIYRLVEDIRKTAESLVPSEPEERITARGKIIALFKSSHRDIILGCQVNEGVIALGSAFRVISAMGPIHTGRIASLHIEKDEVKEARPGQQVGIKVENFNQAKIGDLVECFETVAGRKNQPWGPVGEILHVDGK
jgi:translation initiation factor IF-2